MKLKLIIWIMLGCIFFAHYLILESVKEKTSEIEYWQMAMFPNKETMTCVNSGGLDFSIKVEEEYNSEYQGRYYPMTNTIKLSKIDVATISHESYHAVQDIIQEYNLKDDEEYGAYLQGFLTNCVLSLVI